MILMAVRNEIAAELPPSLCLQIAGVRDHQIDARHILARENRSDIHHNQIVLILINRHVLADFAQAAQRDDGLSLGSLLRLPNGNASFASAKTMSNANGSASPAAGIERCSHRFIIYYPYAADHTRGHKKPITLFQALIKPILV